MGTKVIEGLIREKQVAYVGDRQLISSESFEVNNGYRRECLKQVRRTKRTKNGIGTHD